MQDGIVQHNDARFGERAAIDLAMQLIVADMIQRYIRSGARRNGSMVS